MSPEKQRIAIAEACGWENVHRFDRWREGGPVTYRDGDLIGDFGGRRLRHLPNYLRDLNAMHEAEKTLPDDPRYSKRNYYASILGSLTRNDNGRGWEPLSNDDCFPILHATAPQRAEAFLRALNLWEDEA